MSHQQCSQQSKKPERTHGGIVCEHSGAVSSRHEHSRVRACRDEEGSTSVRGQARVWQRYREGSERQSQCITGRSQRSRRLREKMCQVMRSIVCMWPVAGERTPLECVGMLPLDRRNDDGRPAAPWLTGGKRALGLNQARVRKWERRYKGNSRNSEECLGDGC